MNVLGEGIGVVSCYFLSVFEYQTCLFCRFVSLLQLENLVFPAILFIGGVGTGGIKICAMTSSRIWTQSTTSIFWNSTTNWHIQWDIYGGAVKFLGKPKRIWCLVRFGKYVRPGTFHHLKKIFVIGDSDIFFLFPPPLFLKSHSV